MAIVTVSDHICKGVRNVNSGDIMSMWKTQFNMPVPMNIWSSSPTFDGINGPFTFYGEATSFDLTGFETGFETLLGVTIVKVEGPFAGGQVWMSHEWKNPLGELQFGTFFSNPTTLPSLGAGVWSAFGYSTNQGVESYEFRMPGTHTHTVQLFGALSGTYTKSFTLSNVPDTTNIASQQGMIWVEGTQLCYTSYQWDIHRITGYNTGVSAGVGNAGKFWVEGEDVAWIGSDGYKYNSGYSLTSQAKRSMRQVQSSFSNGATGQTFAGSGNAGKIWMDTEFGHQHIGFIGASGYKNLLYSGNYPWVAP